MIKPTQAPIEAPFEIYNAYGLNCEIADKNGHICTAESEEIAKAIIAALTAAAEDNRHSKMFDYISGKATGRVAELEAQLEHMMAYCVAASDVDMAVAATIERCAQVLEKRRNNLLKDGTGPTLLIAEAMKGDIAAIRALKDKP